jgi:apolipoprotein N-acyltransferase
MLAGGAALTIFACGGRWDIALAAWLSPILLLRFSRTSAVPLATIGLLAASLTQNVAYFLLNAIPLNPLTAMLCGLVSIALALPAILDRTLGARLSETGRLFLLPVAMVAVEYVVGSILPVGTALGMRAITQGENLALLQITSIAGPYAIAFLIGWTATVANRIMEAPSRHTIVRHGAVLVGVLALVLAFGQARLAWTPTAWAKTVTVAAIVPDAATRRASDNLLSTDPASSSTPYRRAVQAAVAGQLLDDTRRAARAGAEIIAWSETAAPTTAADKPALLGQVSRVARSEGVYINAAIGVARQRNETFLFGPDRRLIWHYRKNHPVPGMEPVEPFANAVPVAETRFGRLSNLICFDGDFPALARVDADLMLEPSWDWPEVTYAHTMRMIRLRAIENGYALVRPTFDGLTAAFDRFGRTLAMRATMGDREIVMVKIPLDHGRTIYNRTGDIFAFACVLALLAFGWRGLGRPLVRP